MYNTLDSGDTTGDSSLTFMEALERCDDSLRAARSVALFFRPALMKDEYLYLRSVLETL